MYKGLNHYTHTHTRTHDFSPAWGTGVLSDDPVPNIPNKRLGVLNLARCSKANKSSTLAPRCPLDRYMALQNNWNQSEISGIRVLFTKLKPERTPEAIGMGYIPLLDGFGHPFCAEPHRRRPSGASPCEALGIRPWPADECPVFLGYTHGIRELSNQLLNMRNNLRTKAWFRRCRDEA